MVDRWAKSRKGWRVLSVFVALVAGLPGLLASVGHVHAQQSVTVSGRVTDDAGHAAPGAFVYAVQMPGSQYITGKSTTADGRYSFAVPAGTYRLRVNAEAPLVDEESETLTLSGDTTWDVVLERGVTLSGRVLDPAHHPVQGAAVNLFDDQTIPWRLIGSDASDTGGNYAVAAHPGTYRLQVYTGGRYELLEIKGVSLTGDQTLDLVLSSGVVIAGQVVDERGQPLPGLLLSADDLTVGCCPEYYDRTRADGTFRLNVPPAVYVITADPLPPLQPARVQVDARGGDVTGLVIQVSARPAPFVPDEPPRAALIHCSSPDAVDQVTVTGAAGAVPPGSYVILVTLETGHVAYTQAGEDGRFSASLFAPAGTSILVKTDPIGVSLERLLNVELQQGGAGSIAALPGTIVRVADPPAVSSGVPFGGAGWTRFATLPDSPLPAWTFQGTLSRQDLAPGGTLRVQGTLRITSPALQGAGAMQVHTRLTLERFAGGLLGVYTYASAVLTPTDLPIERMPRWFNEGLDRGVTLPITKVGADRAEAVVDLSLTLPADFPAGFYRPRIDFYFVGVPVEAPLSRPVITIAREGRRPQSVIYLPTVRVGSPPAPRLFWTLLTDTPSHGTRGVGAVEDRGQFGVASRILTQSETFIVPRLDAASGEILTYRLEPFAPAVSLGDQSPPNPPSIPFRFPSGSLTVRVRKPDGAVDVLGPAPFVQARMTSLVDRDGQLLDAGGGHITDVYQLSTVDPHFEVQFTQDGLHTITLEGTIEDLWGNTWSGGGTYEVYVAQLLALDTAVLPMTPFEVGDVFNPGVVFSPPVPADVEVRFKLAPNSDASRMVERTVRGRANRFGYFHPAAGALTLDQPGEYRLDVTASFRDEQGTLWMGARTWGGVVAPRDADIVAHGRRGIDAQPSIGSQWFFRTQTGIAIGGNHVPFPFNSGDIQWLQKSDAAIPLVTFQDPGGALAGLLRTRALESSGQYQQVPLTPPGTFDQRAAAGEVPLFSSRPDRLDPHLDPARVDLWGYSYRSVQRPLVRVREEIGEDQLPPPYWRFHEQFAGQTGVGKNGDLPHEIKFLYAAAVLRGPALTQPHYAVHGALFVLVPDDDEQGGTRTFPPFQGNGGGPSGGPIMTLKGREINLFLHLTGVRPGSVLEVGDTFALSGAVGPPLPALVRYRLTRPGGGHIDFSGRANRVGYYYRPEHDFVVDEPGVYTVDLTVTYDGRTSAGQVGEPFPTGDVLGSASGRFFVYVVPRGSVPLEVDLPGIAFLPPPAQLDVMASAPAGMTLSQGHVTALMPGFLLETGEVPPSGGLLSYSYEPAALAADFPNLDVDFYSTPQAADVVTITLFASGTHADGSPTYAARILTLHGQELFTAIAAGEGASCIGTGHATLRGMVRSRGRPAPGIPGVTLMLSGPAGCTDTTTTDSSGSYRVPTLADGRYTVTPGKTGCQFTPQSREVTIGDRGGRASFVGTCP